MSVLILAVTFLLLSFFAQPVLAHDGRPLAPQDLWSAWNFQPAIVLSIATVAWMYLRGQRELRLRTRLSKSGWRTAGFLAGLVMLCVALISPLDALSSALLSAHMLQHIILVLVAPPLLVSGVPLNPVLHAFSPPKRKKLGRAWRRAKSVRAAWRALAQMPVAWTLHVLVLWAWHAPLAYEAALRTEIVHILEHLSFLGTALLFWWLIMHPRGRASAGAGSGILALFTMALQSGLLGALLTFAPAPWYAAYASTTRIWGLTPLEDQQLAGAIMWIPGGTVYTLAASALFLVRLAGIEGMARRREIQGLGVERVEEIFSKEK